MIVNAPNVIYHRVIILCSRPTSAFLALMLYAVLGRQRAVAAAWSAWVSLVCTLQYMSGTLNSYWVILLRRVCMCYSGWILLQRGASTMLPPCTARLTRCVLFNAQHACARCQQLMPLLKDLEQLTRGFWEETHLSRPYIRWLIAGFVRFGASLCY